MTVFPPLPGDRQPTLDTLHAYAHAAAALPRAHAVPHPKWWHISLKVRPDGLATEAMPLPDGGAAYVRIDPRNNEVVFETSGGERRAFPMNADLTATQMGNALIAAGEEFGLTGEYDRSKFENDDPRPYDADIALGIFQAFVSADSAIAAQRNRITGAVGPIQLWPHGFDLAFEWYGTRTEPYEENGVATELPSQINFGFYPAGDAYFYSNPWPFDTADLVGIALPDGARWNTEGWEGSMLPYADVAGDPDGVDRFLAFTGTVFDAAAPLLTR
jgi:hypothetical protein